MIEGLDEDFKLAVSVPIAYGRGCRSAIAVAVTAGIGKRNIMQQATIRAENDKIPGISYVGAAIGREEQLGGAVLIEVRNGDFGSVHHRFAMGEVKTPQFAGVGAKCVNKAIVE